MNKLKQQFLSMRESTPKHVQWLLLAAAFIVVLILLTLLMTGSRNKPRNTITEDVPIHITLSTDTVNWSDVTVGTKKAETIYIKSNVPAKVSVTQNKAINGFTTQNTCTPAIVINEKISCRITLEYAPTAAAKPETLTFSVYYHGENEPETMKDSAKVIVILGATAPTPVVTPAPAPKPAPVYEPQKPIEQEFDDDEYDDYDDYNDEPIKDAVKSIAPSDPFTSAPVVTPAPAAPRPSESCSDFAFPGYDMNGAQMGWIKPERGGYYFYPFSDKNCKNPTGTYNPGTGIIMDINSAGKKIGTDAEHINYAMATGVMPTLGESPRVANRATSGNGNRTIGAMGRVELKPAPVEDVIYDTTDTNAIVSTQPYDRTFILRQYKPIPATIVSDVRADVALDENNMHFPVRATVDRNVYSDDGRTIIIPTGTLLLGYVTGNVPGPYKAIGRMNIKWYQFILPNGVEFNFEAAQQPISADAQGRIGVPGRGSTDYLEQFVMPMLTSIVPAAVNMVAPVADKFVNQIDLDNNTVVQSGTMRSSELAKNEIITAWNQVAQKLLVDMMDNTVPPFTIPAGTRITVYSANDLMVACTTDEKCIVKKTHTVNDRLIKPTERNVSYNPNDGSWVGQARSFDLQRFCEQDSNKIWGIRQGLTAADTVDSGYSYSTILGYCQSLNYQAINNARQAALYQNQQDSSNSTSIANISKQGTKTYNEQVLGLKYNEDGSIQNPFNQTATATESEPVIKCEDGTNPDSNGCCTGEIYTDMGEQGFNCCPETGGDCFPPIL